MCVAVYLSLHRGNFKSDVRVYLHTYTCTYVVDHYNYHFCTYSYVHNDAIGLFMLAFMYKTLFEIIKSYCVLYVYSKC